MREPFILTDPPDSLGRITVTEEEAHHLTGVLRFEVGDLFVAFDGAGHGWNARVSAISRKKLEAVIESEIMAESFTRPISVAIGTVKGPRMEWAVEKAAELGCARMIPLKTRYSVVEPGEGRSRRWRGIAIAAAKQSRRVTLMETCPAKKLTEFNFSEYGTILVFDLTPDSLPIEEALHVNKSSHPDVSDGILLIIGPEGGFTDEERDLLKASGSRFVTMGNHTMRTETALTAAIILTRHALEIL